MTTPPPLLVIAEDDLAFSHTLGRSFERRGYRVRVAASLAALLTLLAAETPDYAVVDLKLGGGASGLVCVQAVHAHDPATLIIVLTSYASIAITVEAIQLSASHYLAKPSNADEFEAASAMSLAVPG